MIAAPVDALGVNYYMPMRLSALPDSTLPFQMEPIPGYPVTAFGWPVVPAGLTELLVLLRERYGAALPPVYITENGCSADDQVTAAGAIGDEDRISYLDGHVRAVHKAMEAGVDVRGYFVWSLMDNFEWTDRASTSASASSTWTSPPSAAPPRPPSPGTTTSSPRSTAEPPSSPARPPRAPPARSEAPALLPGPLSRICVMIMSVAARFP